MNIDHLKGWKPVALKIVAIAISLSYAFGPLLSDIDQGIHQVIHFFEAPDNLLAHEIPAAKIIEEHPEQEHRKKDDAHKHTVIELMDTLSDALEHSSTDDPLLVEFKFDKHFFEKEIYLVPFDMVLIAKTQGYTIENKTRNGYLFSFKEPPQFITS